MTQEALSHDVHGRVVLEVILCRTGRITDLKVIEGLPYGMTAKAVEAALRLTFIPAEMNFHSVSQRQRLEYSFNPRVSDAIVASRLVEAIEVVGNRRLSDSAIMQHVQSKPGEAYDEQQVQRDFASILSTGSFDKTKTRVTIAAGARGGVVITFEVVELPIITEVKFQGLDPVAESVLVEVLLNNHIDVRKGAIYDSLQMKIAREVIRRLLESNGQSDVKVEVRTEQVSATSVALTFLISRE